MTSSTQSRVVQVHRVYIRASAQAIWVPSAECT